MTHLTDYSYLERGMGLVIFFAWAVIHIYIVDKFRVFRFENFQRKDTKTIVTTLLFISMTFSIIYDILGSYVKYAEGFSLDNSTRNINGELNCVIRPKTNYSSYNKTLVTVADYMLDISWSLKSCSLFLIQLIWNHVVKKFKTRPFVSTIEAKIHIIMAIISLLAYPILQTSFSYVDDRFSTIAPQFVSHLENFLIGTFCFIMSYRFKKLIAQSSGFQSKAISRIRYYITLNILMGTMVWMDGLFLFIINIDAINKLTSAKDSPFPFIAKSKFWLDFCTKLFNFGFIHTYPIAFLILFPFGSEGSKSEESNTGRRVTTNDGTMGAGVSKAGLEANQSGGNISGRPPMYDGSKNELRSNPDIANTNTVE